MNPTLNPTAMPNPNETPGALPNPVNPNPMMNNPEPLGQGPAMGDTNMTAASPNPTVGGAAPVNPNPTVGGAAPVNPVINPVVNPATQATPGAAGFNPTMANGSPVFENTATNTVNNNPTFDNTAAGAANNPVFDPSAPLMMPEPVTPPDPEEEELKAPMKAAEPVPGSIGSAISMSGNEAAAAQPQTPSVSFSDPATEAANMPAMENPMAMNNPATPTKKKKFSFSTKMDKKNLIMLCAVAGIVVLVLVIVLVMMLNGMI